MSRHHRSKWSAIVAAPRQSRAYRLAMFIAVGSVLLVSVSIALRAEQPAVQPQRVAGLPQQGGDVLVHAGEHPSQAMPVGVAGCQAPPCPVQLGTPLPAQIFGVHCDGCDNCGEKNWNAMGPIPWGVLAQGEYIGPARIADVPVYRLRVDDRLDFVYRLTRQETSQAYRLDIGDQIRIESPTEPSLNQPEVIAPPDVIGLIIQPDGTVSLRMLGTVKVAGMTVDQVRRDLEERYKQYYREPRINVVPYSFNLKLKDIRDAVDRRWGAGGQSQPVRVTPEGTVQLPGIGSVPVQGLTLDELKREVDRRYIDLYGEGLDITPILTERSPRYVFIVGEVRNPGRYLLERPTSVIGSISMAGGWNVGANLNHVVVFRRDDNWRLMATRLDVRGALYGRRPCPTDDVWLRDNDIVIVPKSPILVADDAISLLFTRGLYAVLPINYTVEFLSLSSL